MIPYQGFIASILAIIALIVLWNELNSMLWWIILGLLITDYLFTNTLKESLKLYGEEDKATIKWGIIVTVTQISLIGISIYAILLFYQ